MLKQIDGYEIIKEGGKEYYFPLTRECDKIPCSKCFINSCGYCYELQLLIAKERGIKLKETK